VLRLLQRLNRTAVVGGRGRGDEVLVAFLNPFDRPSGFARRDRHQHDVGEDGMLGAKAATRIRRRFQAKPVGRPSEAPLPLPLGDAPLNRSDTSTSHFGFRCVFPIEGSELPMEQK